MEIPKYLDEKVVAEMTGVGLGTLRNNRSRGIGIPYTKAGKSVRYSLNDVIAYMEERKILTDPLEAHR
jgi:hypothetical protein